MVGGDALLTRTSFRLHQFDLTRAGDAFVFRSFSSYIGLLDFAL